MCAAGLGKLWTVWTQGSSGSNTPWAVGSPAQRPVSAGDPGTGPQRPSWVHPALRTILLLPAQL